MEVELHNISKRYIFDWIIKDLTFVFPQNSVTGISGINGSGKSTLIKMISGWLSPSNGKILYQWNNKIVSRSDVYAHVSIVAPFTDLISEFDLEESFRFHTKFKKFSKSIEFEQFQSIVNLKEHRGKPLKYYSSGMRQRVQLALATLTKSKLLLLDEPTAYLDTENKKWFYSLLFKNIADKTVIISSNDNEDFQYCAEILKLR